MRKIYETYKFLEQKTDSALPLKAHTKSIYLPPRWLESANIHTNDLVHHIPGWSFTHPRKCIE